MKFAMDQTQYHRFLLMSTATGADLGFDVEFDAHVITRHTDIPIYVIYMCSYIRYCLVVLVSNISYVPQCVGWLVGRLIFFGIGYNRQADKCR